MADRHDEAHRTPVERLGLTSVARSLGSAVASVRRLVPALGFGRGAQPGRPGALQAFEASRQRLRAEIGDLESELERLHSLITSSAVVSDARPGAERPTVDSLLAKSRQLRDRLHEKRYRLARIERSIARERRLSAMSPSTPAPEPKPGRRMRPEAPPRAAQRDERNDPRVRAIFKAVDKALFENRTAKLEFKRLAERLADANPNIRREAVNRLGELEHPAAFDLLLVAVGDPNERVRLAALNGLGGMSRAAPADLFRSFLHDRNSSLRLAALRGLASMGSGALAVTELTAAIEDADPAVRKTAATVLGWHRSKGKAMALVFPALSLALRDEEEGVRIAAAEALGSLCDARAVLPLIRALTDASPRVRQEATRALRNTAGEEVDLIGQDLDAEARATALKTWWADARVHVVVGQGGAATESDASPDDLQAAVDAPALEDESGEDFERLLGDEPSDSVAVSGADAAAAKPAVSPQEPAPAAPKESAPAAAAPASAPKQAKPAAKEPAPAPAPKAPAAEPASTKPDAAGPEFENLFPGGDAAAVGEGEGEGAAEGDEASVDGEYEDPFGGGS